MTCSEIFKYWVSGMLQSILATPLDTPEPIVKRNPIFLPRDQILPLPHPDITRPIKLTKIPCASVNGNPSVQQLVWVFTTPQTKCDINTHVKIPLLEVCDSTMGINIFMKKKKRMQFVLKSEFCSEKCPTIITFLTYISPYIVANECQTGSTKGLESKSTPVQNTDPSFS